MTKKMILASITFLGLSVIGAISCNQIVNDCGPFKDKYATIDFQTDLMSITAIQTPMLSVEYSPLESNTTEIETFAISMFPVVEYYSLNNSLLTSFSFSPVVYACSPSIPVSEEMISDIRIFSNRAFNSGFTSDQNLAELFEVVVLYRNTGYAQIDLIQFLNSNPKVPDEIFLILKSTPESSEPIRFTIKYEQEGRNMDFFEFTTESIVITNEV